MVKVWHSYKSDLDKAYPMLPIAIANLSDISTDIDIIDLLALSVLEVKHPCAVSGLTPRLLKLWLNDGAQLSINYPQPFNALLIDRLNARTQVVAWEFIGERLKYGRLKKLLDNAVS